MKDKKFTILCILGAIWLVMFIAMLCGARINPRIEALVAFLCVGWFAFWTLSTVKAYFFKNDAPPIPPTQPTPETISNAKSQNPPQS